MEASVAGYQFGYTFQTQNSEYCRTKQYAVKQFAKSEAVSFNQFERNIMDINCMRPKEFDNSTNATEECVKTVDAQVTDMTTPARIAQEGWNTGDISAYRAAYVKAHSLDP